MNQYRKTELAVSLTFFAVLFLMCLYTRDVFSSDFNEHLASPAYKKGTSGVCHVRGSRPYTMIKQPYSGFKSLFDCVHGRHAIYKCYDGKCARK